jgi:poly [ADP-ribose] polymerase 10/14/15
MKSLPLRQAAGNLYYDSSTDDLNNPSMYVIFYDTQAYPEYIVTFK